MYLCVPVVDLTTVNHLVEIIYTLASVWLTRKLQCFVNSLTIRKQVSCGISFTVCGKYTINNEQYDKYIFVLRI